MELKDFIKTAITDITEAISELQSELNNGTVINPTLGYGDYGKAVIVKAGAAAIEHLSFDVAVTVSEHSGLDGRVKAGINILGTKIETETNTKTENVSRLSFSIPIVYPATHTETPSP